MHAKKKTSPELPDPQVFRHKEAILAFRPEGGAQAIFKRARTRRSTDPTTRLGPTCSGTP